MHEQSSFLLVAVVFLLAAVVAVPLAKKLRLGAVIGYLLAGVVIGPSMLNLIDHPENVSHISELGVVLLLFIIGLELSPRRLWLMRKAVFGVGLAQVMLCASLIGSIAYVGLDQPVNTAVVLGLGLALSSTAFGLQIIAERKELNSPHGRLAFAILLFQDIAAIPLIALIPLLGSATGDAGGESNLEQIIKVVGSIALIVVGGRYLLRPVFRIVARTGLQEVSTATALLVVIGTAWLMQSVGVSMALGAFLAGLLLADSEYRHELESQIEPFKGLLLGLFFISVGMTADIGLLVTSPAAVLLLTALIIGCKLPLIYLVGRVAGGLNQISALRLGVVLAAGGEFAFVVFQMARDQQLFDQPMHSMLVLAITLSMAVTPLIILVLSQLIKPKPTTVEVPEEYQHIDTDEPRVVISGMGRMGQVIARVLRAQRIPYVGLETSVDSIEMSRSLSSDMPIFYGDPMRPEILRAAQVDKAQFFIITTDDPDANLKTAELVRRLYPHVTILARARNRQHVHRLIDLGALAVRETFHSSLEMSKQVLTGLGLSETQANSRIKRFRQHDEQVLAAQHQVYDDAAAVMQTAREARADLERLFDADRIEEDSIDELLQPK
ncbi:MAG TPA: glutathione-regulated potassium-efflux system protein KefB [Pseudomonas sabulinigri]|uniref:RCK N-terminal domain-containing protein n=1 Tax=marine sediment metagenome TaxID=412755 RepID=A0A0F9XJJ5_9ZZZZ|nr:glutathione-regulated potassium-efflux system protein KefB [Halopseudomonas sabulinigri]HEC53413.1 glutathione-regulated potassium-efflux system protein KefB [Halopseudomonas sabulinigri]